VSEGQALYRIDPATNDVAPIEGVFAPTDVAAGQGTVWVLEEDALTRIDPETRLPVESFPVAPADNRDLQLSEGAVWVANGDAGEVTRVDIETGDQSEPVYLGGNFTAIAWGEGSMWMVSGDKGDDGNLTRIDPETTDIIGQPVSLGGRPFDVTTGAGSVWVVNNSAESVSRLDPNALPRSVPSEGA
jgi:streptogramin lyase